MAEPKQANQATGQPKQAGGGGGNPAAGSDDFLDLAMLDEIPDQHVLEDGSTHEVEVVKAEIGESGPDAKTAGQKYLRVTFKATDDPESQVFNDIFMLPFKGLDKETFNMRGRMLRQFFESFEFDYHGWNIFQGTQDLVGIRGEVIVRVKDDPMYGEQNEVKRYM